MESKQGKLKISRKKGDGMSWKMGLLPFFMGVKLLVAIGLDGADLVLGNIPLVNTVWDMATMIVLSVLLRHRYLAFFAVTEVFIPWFPPLGQIDALLPMATILTLMDIGMTRLERQIISSSRG